MRYCTLEESAGVRAECPADPCPFWEGDACALRGLSSEIRARPELAPHLRDVRRGIAGNPERFGLPD